MIKGVVKWFDVAKGFGFIDLGDDKGDVLLHANVLRNFGRSSVAEGAGIAIEIQETERGRQASSILGIDAAAPNPAVKPPSEAIIPGDPNAPILAARVKWFDRVKGFGFVNIFGSAEDIFIHMEVLRLSGLADLLPGEAIAVRIRQGERGNMVFEVHSWDHAVQPMAAESSQ